MFFIDNFIDFKTVKTHQPVTLIESVFPQQWRRRANCEQVIIFSINWDIKSFREYNLPEVLGKKYNGFELDFCHSTDVDFKKQKNMEFFKLDSGFFIQHTDKFESCKKCYNELFKIDGKKYCLSCDYDRINRTLKLNKILKNANIRL